MNNIIDNNIISDRPITRRITRYNKQLSFNKVNLSGDDLN